jgi:hypothetical protein
LGTGAAMLSYEVHCSIGNCWLERIGAIQGEVISPVAGPVIIGQEEPLVNLAKNLGFYQLSF